MNKEEIYSILRSIGFDIHPDPENPDILIGTGLEKSDSIDHNRPIFLENLKNPDDFPKSNRYNLYGWKKIGDWFSWILEDSDGDRSVFELIDRDWFCLVPPMD